MTAQKATRSNSEALPSPDELILILEKESPRRTVRFDYLLQHADAFDALRKLAETAATDISWLDQYAEMALSSLLLAIGGFLTDTGAFIANHPEQRQLYENVYRGLVLEDDDSPSDAIFVFGAHSNARIERAVELYSAGVAPKIIISGKGPVYKDAHESEAERMARYAEAHGVARNALILEDASITMPDNVKRTVDHLETINWQPASVTVVATNMALLRGVSEWYKFTPWAIEGKSVAAHVQNPAFTAETWFTDDATVKLVLNEYAKLVIEAKMDLIRKDQR